LPIAYHPNNLLAQFIIHILFFINDEQERVKEYLTSSLKGKTMLARVIESFSTIPLKEDTL